MSRLREGRRFKESNAIPSSSNQTLWLTPASRARLPTLSNRPCACALRWAAGFIDWLYDLLQVVRQLVSRLVELDVVRTRHDHHDDAAVHLILDGAAELRPFRPQLADRGIDVVAHQRNRMMAWRFKGLALPFTASRMHAQLARPRFENEPILVEILGDALPPKDIA